jgi:tetratricopeptide (TPR) repeat protein
MKKILLFVLASSISMMTMAQPPMGGGGGGMRGGGPGGPGGFPGGAPQGGGNSITAAIGAGTNASEAKPVLDAKKALDKAIAASQNSGKAAKAATWVALSDAYVKAYDAPTQNLLPNSSMSDVSVFLKGQKATSLEPGTGADGVEYQVLSYDNKDLYFRDGILDFWVVTKPVVDNALDKAYEALEKGYSLDPKAATNKAYAEKAQVIYKDLYDEAVNIYLAGNAAAASKAFDKASAVSEGKILNAFDSMSVYNSGLMASMSGDNDKAIAKYKLCLDKGFYNDGTVYSNLADLYKQAGDAETAMKLLEDGFAKFPNSQAILVGLINHYLETNTEPDKLFTLLHNAQANDPKNASLYYVEGDAFKKLGDYDKAIELYDKATSVDPTYIYGILNKGLLYYDRAVEVQEKASLEMDDAKYAVLVEELNGYLEKAIDPFEKAFAMAKDNDIKLAIAEYLKNIYYRFRDKSADYQAAYEKYNSFLKGE